MKKLRCGVLCESTETLLQALRFEYVMTQCHLLMLRSLLRLVVGLILTTSHWWWLTQLLVHGIDHRVVEQTMHLILQLQLLRAILHTAFSLSTHVTRTQAFGVYTLYVIHWSVRWEDTCTGPSCLSFKSWVCCSMQLFYRNCTNSYLFIFCKDKSDRLKLVYKFAIYVLTLEYC